MQTSNWLQAGDKERYGSGEIFAFTDKRDAIRWAGKMDWVFNKKMGSGKISVLTMTNGKEWDIDDADPAAQASNKGKWLKSFGRIAPEHIIKAEPFTPDMMKLLNT